MMIEPVRWGLIGAGRIAAQFAADFRHVSGATLVAVGARSAVAAREFATRWSVGHACAGYEAIYAHPEVDIVYIATPHSLHFEQAAAALRAGKAVLCEKPITTSARECEALADLAHACNCYLAEGMWSFFLPAVATSLQWVAAGRIGTLVQVKADFGYPIPYAPDRREYDATLGGGALLEMGIYPVSLALRLIQSDPGRLHVVARRADNGVEDELAVLCDFGAASASLGTSFRSKLPNVAYLIGTSGYIQIPDFWRARECRLFRLDDCIDHFVDKRTGGGFEYEIRAVSDDVRAGRMESGVVPLRDSLRVQRHMERILRACDARQTS